MRKEGSLFFPDRIGQLNPYVLETESGPTRLFEKKNPQIFFKKLCKTTYINLIQNCLINNMSVKLYVNYVSIKVGK